MRGKTKNVLKLKKYKIKWQQYIAGVYLIALISLIYQYILGKNASLLFGCSLYFLFGSAFFFSGIYANVEDNQYGILFLFTHALPGFLIMIATLLVSLFINPIISDTNPIILITILALIVVSSILGFVYEIIYRTDSKFKEKKNAVFIPLIFFGIAVLLAGILPFIVDKLR